MQSIRWMGGLALIATVATGIAATSRRTSGANPDTVVGTWRLVSAKENGKAIDVPAGTTILKHCTPTDFIFVYYNQQGLITVAGGGRYSLTGNHYAETVEYGYGEGMAPYIGKTQDFNLRIDGQRWYHSGTETNGNTVEEIWERAPAVGPR